MANYKLIKRSSMSSSWSAKKNSIMKLKVVEKLQRSFVVLSSSSSKKENEDVPEDVKEGHFAVIAEEEDESKRFVVPLTYLTHPTFLSLLEQAADVYGFASGGALTLPCRPAKLQMILMSDHDQQNTTNIFHRVDDHMKTGISSC